MSGKIQDILSSALPPRYCKQNASPKAISRRISYYQARLVFRFLPQLVPEYCTAHGFGPLPGFLRDSPWPWQARLASDPLHFLNSCAFNARFHFAFSRNGIRQRKCRDSLARYAKSTPSSKHITSYVLDSDFL